MMEGGGLPLKALAGVKRHLMHHLELLVQQVSRDYNGDVRSAWFQLIEMSTQWS